MEKRAINLTFHGVGSPARELERFESDVWVSREQFRATLDSAVDRDDVRFTFDDGNASDIDVALPALRERGLTATFFVVAGRLGLPGFLDAPTVRELQDAGMTIGCHGMRHRHWGGLEESALHEELIQAKAQLEEITERPIREAACPFGSYDRRSLKMLRAAGYRRVYTSDRGMARTEDFLQVRNTVGPTDGVDLLERIEAIDKRPYAALGRGLKLMVKRWR